MANPEVAANPLATEKTVKAKTAKTRCPRTAPTATKETFHVLILDRKLLLKDLAGKTDQEATAEIGNMTNLEATREEKTTVEAEEERKYRFIILFS